MFKIDYPLQKADLVSIKEFTSAMENWGLITFTENKILISDKASVNKKTIVA